jgi:hypothetical protein
MEGDLPKGLRNKMIGVFFLCLISGIIAGLIGDDIIVGTALGILMGSLAVGILLTLILKFET